MEAQEPRPKVNFVSQEILNKKGAFGIIWLAAVHPKLLNRRDYMNVDVHAKCKDLIRLTAPEWRPRQAKYMKIHLSLYYCAHLLTGLAHINRMLVVYLLDDVTHIQQRLKTMTRPLELPPPTQKQKDSVTMKEPNYDLFIFPEPEEMVRLMALLLPQEGEALPHTVQPSEITMVEPPAFPREPSPAREVPEEAEDNILEALLAQLPEVEREMLPAEARPEVKRQKLEDLVTPPVQPPPAVALRPRAPEPPAEAQITVGETPPQPRRDVQRTPPSPAPRRGRPRRARTRARGLIKDVPNQLSLNVMKERIYDPKISTVEWEKPDFRKRKIPAEDLLSQPGGRILTDVLGNKWKRLESRPEPDITEPPGAFIPLRGIPEAPREPDVTEPSEEIPYEGSTIEKPRKTVSISEKPGAESGQMLAELELSSEVLERQRISEPGASPLMLYGDRTADSAVSLPLAVPSPSISTVRAISGLEPILEGAIEEVLELTEEMHAEEEEEMRTLVSPIPTLPPPSPSSSESGIFKREIIKSIKRQLEAYPGREYVPFRALGQKTRKQAAKIFGELLQFHASRIVFLQQDEPYDEIRVYPFTNFTSYSSDDTSLNTSNSLTT